jgi:hypothetical protein
LVFLLPAAQKMNRGLHTGADLEDGPRPRIFYIVCIRICWKTIFSKTNF